MDTLRWILLIVGVLVIAGLFGYYKCQERQATRPQRGARGKARTAGRKTRSDRDVEAALEDMDDFVLGDDVDGDVDPDPGLSAMNLTAAEDESVGRSRPASVGGPSHHETPDDEDWTVGTVRVRQVGEPAAERPRPAAGEGRQPETQDAWDEPLADEPEMGVGEPEDDPIQPEPVDRPARAGRDDDDAWNLGPVRIPRPAWGRDTHGREERARQQDEAATEEAITEAVGEKIVVLHVHAGEGLCFTAPAVQEALEASGLRFGQHGIFHRHVDTSHGQQPMFSVASMVKPGTLNPDEPDTLETPGLALFMQLPGPFDGLSAFEQMLEVARRLADQLEGHLLDGTRCDLTNQAVEHIREELREYRRLAHLAARRYHA